MGKGAYKNLMTKGFKNPRNSTEERECTRVAQKVMAQIFSHSRTITAM
jgi:hypothetical protein